MPVVFVTVVFLPASTEVLAALTTLFNCETFTASVSALPAATPVILLPAALIPDLVTLGPLEIVKPLSLMIVSPAFTLSTAIFLFNVTSTWLPLALVVIFLSPLIATSSSSFLTPVLVPLSPVKVKPFLVTVS